VKPEYLKRFPCYVVCKTEFYHERRDSYKKENGVTHEYTVKEPFYLDTRTGELKLAEDLDPGAIWDNEAYHDYAPWCGADGASLHALLPNHEWWHIDGTASNCTDPDGSCKSPPNHKCWVRHGGLGDVSKLHVDKNGPTCKAGAGSIWSCKDTPKDFHGFLHDGHIRPC
jgi:hypothetical protein